MREIRRRLDQGRAVAALSVALALLVGVGALWSREWDPSRLVVAGTSITDPAAAPPDLDVRPGPGYDGQYFYRLALGPFTATRVDYGIKLDDPAYRQQRILYPTLAWALSLGRDGWVPWTLLLVNVVGLAALGMLGAALAASLGRSRLWGLAIPLYPGFTMTLLRDCSELTAVALVLAGLLALRRDRAAIAALCLAAAVLARETSVVVAGAGLVWALWPGRPARPWRAALPFVAPLATFAAWEAFLRVRWGTFPIASGKGSATFPLRAALAQVSTSLGDGGAGGFRLVVEIALVLAFLAVVAVRLRGARLRGYETVACALSIGLAVVLARDVWVEDWSFVRVLSDAAALGTLALLSRPGRRDALFVAATWAALWVAVGPSLG